MRITDLPKTKDILMNNLFITDGDGGTRAIFAEDLSKALYAFLDDADKVGTVNFDKLLKTQTVKNGDKILVNTDEGNRQISLKDFQYAFMDAVANTPMRRNTFRGKNLGSVVTEEQLTEIGNGTFKDLFIGDYWEITGTRDNLGVTKRRFRIVDMDYWYSIGWTGYKCWAHHVTVMPDYVFSENGGGTWNRNVSGGYLGSNIRKVLKETIKPKILSFFPSNTILNYHGQICDAVINGVPSGLISHTPMDIEIPTTESITGNVFMAGQSNYNTMGPGFNSADNRQFALFKIEPSYIQVRYYNNSGEYTYGQAGYWMRNIVGVGTPCIGGYDLASGYLHIDDLNANIYFRPTFAIKKP